jgi:hypothetical protein
MKKPPTERSGVLLSIFGLDFVDAAVEEVVGGDG